MLIDFCLNTSFLIPNTSFLIPKMPSKYEFFNTKKDFLRVFFFFLVKNIYLCRKFLNTSFLIPKFISKYNLFNTKNKDYGVSK